MTGRIACPFCDFRVDDVRSFVMHLTSEHAATILEIKRYHEMPRWRWHLRRLKWRLADAFVLTISLFMKLDEFVMDRAIRPAVHWVENFTGWSPFAMARNLLRVYFVMLTIDTWWPGMVHENASIQWVLFSRTFYVLLALGTLSDIKATRRAQRASFTDAPAQERFVWKIGPPFRLWFGFVMMCCIPTDVYNVFWNCSLHAIVEWRGETLILACWCLHTDPKNPAMSTLAALKNRLRGALGSVLAPAGA